MIRSRMIGTGSYLPERVMTNADLENMVETTDEWIRSRTGIRERRIAADDETTSDMAAEAAKRAIQHAGISPRKIDLIVLATATPDMAFPSTACIVQHRIGIAGVAAFDISAACSGFLYAVGIADQFLRNQSAKTALVIGAEKYSKIMDWTDRRTCVLFGDGAGAVLLHGEKGDRGILSTHLHADGSYADMLMVARNGSKNPITRELIKTEADYLVMRGNELFKVAVKTLEEAVLEALRANGMACHEVDLLIPHQANMRIIAATAKRLKISMDKVVINLDRYGNTSAASIPIALDEAVKENRVHPGDRLLFESFGGGLTWASAMVRW
ncbi:MAG: 3-oxoacyl-ACP synthase [Nitrospirae bacterium CG_4_9_14_3_um_filter_53_35]|nr:MAG: 3-oxoacyl-ACP synthase [Nitrospirae bacterium CG08_land_8_20_14_0_20_52_24]PIV82703.1 MAG: 3-oxoacyl-ACP synthase [Nitrospirae bacterium CG17_big_fil_post_rev_8_21_14_2_50_50_9]PIW85856.1 MAG: 3-oxoacyl-ACP synthase [Nitrospirae bacterium CG_4_8_14_3_um_filter_50_41]PIX86908.1 MAG: 3-oxoacyl-ACP synthase [Nitrospirae bacterium CG_4_10_14_3_um_filter_53_41]PJA77566.1 MAG: 3-oxoacyl-ACP synthase [Nitrospirae bacterium CG_4_9_14_3_um_filter_53_35]